jgi:hypothetical protein
MFQAIVVSPEKSSLVSGSCSPPESLIVLPRASFASFPTGSFSPVRIS